MQLVWRDSGSRRNALYAALEQIGWRADKPAGSFFCWLPVPEGYTSMSFADLLLEEADVVVAPGNGFGANGEGYVRLGLLASESRLVEAAERIGQLRLFDHDLRHSIVSIRRG